MWSVDAMKARSVWLLARGCLDEVWERQRGRLEGLTDDEYLWEPARGCWTVRSVDGGWRVDQRVRPDPVPAPVTTIAWRTWHIGSDCLAGYTVKGLGPWPLEVDEAGWYGTAREALSALDTCWRAFREGVERLGDDGMWSSLGEDWGRYAPEPWAALIFHALDEIAHHGAEIALLRDLYARR